MPDEPLARICANLTLRIGELRGDIRQLTEPFKRADENDWDRLDTLLGYSAHGKFWRSVFKEVRFQLRKVAAETESEHNENEER